MDEEDWDGWQQLTARLGKKLQLVGDDLFVTNVKRLAAGIEKGAGNAILVKVNQIGTLSEAFAAVRLAKENGFRTSFPIVPERRRTPSSRISRWP